MLAASCTYFAIRGPGRAWHGTVDLHVFYASTRAWVFGQNPYLDGDLDEVLHAAGGKGSVNMSLNPPLTFVPLTPWALLPWPAAEKAWLALDLALMGVCLWGVLGLAGVRWKEPRGLFLMALMLAMAPFHTTIAQGQLTLLVTALVILALRANLANSRIMAGALVGMAAALKPQMGLLMVAMLAGRMNWKALLSASAMLAALTIIATGRLAVAGVDWMPALSENLYRFSNGHTGDPLHPLSYLMINLQVAVAPILRDATLTNVLVLLLVAILGLVVLLACRGRQDRHTELLVWSALAVLGLMGLYNRLYSATLLALPLAWAVSQLGKTPNRYLAPIIIALILPFLVPGGAYLGTAGADLAHILGRFWRLVLFHQAYLLAVLGVVLAVAAVKMQNAGQGKKPLTDLVSSEGR